jgi:hypothetical protein
MEMWPDQYFPAMKRLEALGVIVGKGTPTELDTRLEKFEVQASIRDLANEVREEMEQEKAPKQETPDLVDGIIKKARRNPVTSWTIVAVLALAALLIIVNELFDLVTHVRETFGGKPPAVNASPHIEPQPERP